MYTLTTKIYENKNKITSEFEKYGDAVKSAEHIADVLKNIMKLTRHSSCETSISHCGYYVDHYNEVFISVKSSGEYDE